MESWSCTLKGRSVAIMFPLFFFLLFGMWLWGWAHFDVNGGNTFHSHQEDVSNGTDIGETDVRSWGPWSVKPLYQPKTVYAQFWGFMQKLNLYPQLWLCQSRDKHYSYFGTALCVIFLYGYLYMVEIILLFSLLYVIAFLCQKMYIYDYILK